MEEARLITLADFVDPEILDIIIDINALPFIEGTLFCCAGYGKQPELIVTSYPDGFADFRRMDPNEPHVAPYVTIQYYQKGRFHNELSMVMASHHPNQVFPRAWAYTLLPSGKYPDMEAAAKPRWNEVRALLARWRARVGKTVGHGGYKVPEGANQ